MRKKFSARAAALGMSGVLLTSALTGCTFGFASDPDDPNAVKEEVPIDMTTDTFQYDTSLSGTSIVIMNTKAEIQIHAFFCGVAAFHSLCSFLLSKLYSK